jgi:hypothetical protein
MELKIEGLGTVMAAIILAHGFQISYLGAGEIRMEGCSDDEVGAKET